MFYHKPGESKEAFTKYLWAGIPIVNIAAHGVLFIDVSYLLKYSPEASRTIALPLVVQIAFWGVQLFAILLPSFIESLDVVMVILIFSDCLVQCCYFETDIIKYKGYKNPLYFLWNMLKTISWMRAFNVFKSPWPVILLPCVIVGLGCALFVGYKILTNACKIISMKFRWADFKKELPKLGSASFMSVAAGILLILDPFQKTGEFRYVIMGFLFLNLIISFSFCVSTMGVKKFKPHIEDDAASTNGSGIKHPKVQVRSRRNNGKNAVKKYLNFVQAGSTLFKKKIESERGDEEAGAGQCIICFDSKPNTIYYPCFHGGICEYCSRRGFGKRKVCPLCRIKVEKIVVFESDDKGKIFMVDEICA